MESLNLEVLVVLVRPIYARNVGATSRAMDNMGVNRLALIQPQCEIDEEAKKAAATGQEPLSNSQIFKSWDDFHRCYPEGLRLAFTSKDGQSRIVTPFASCLKEMFHFSDLFKKHGNRLVLVFGPEDWGLNNEDISWCHRAVVLPTYGKNPSLNLAQAVLLALFMLQNELQTPTTFIQQRTYQNDFVVEQDWFPDQSFRKFLTALGLKLDDRRVSAYTALRQFFLRALPTRREKRMLQMIFEQAARKIKN